ncbi:hypothetical protein CQB05_10920 [Paracidovorax citrulli]|nr:hypothetical protein CQB05_10920 [Paracidovorax citrulli]
MSAGSDHPGYLGLENIESWTGRIIEVESKRDDEPADQSAGLANIFREGDVLFCKLRPYLAKACHAPRDGVGSTELLVMRPSELLEPRFLLYSILTPDFVGAVDASTFGAKMPRANWDFIGSLEVKVPPLEEQRLIANYLDRETAGIDGLIAEKERMLALLEEKRAALISRVVTRGLDPNAPLKPSGQEWLGEIPVHWGLQRLKQLAEVRGGLTLGKQYSGELLEYPYLRVANVQDGYLKLDDVLTVEVPASEAASNLLVYGDVLMNEGVTSTSSAGAVFGETRFRLASIRTTSLLSGHILLIPIGSRFGHRRSRQSAISRAALSGRPILHPYLDRTSRSFPFPCHR